MTYRNDARNECGERTGCGLSPCVVPFDRAAASEEQKFGPEALINPTTRNRSPNKSIIIFHGSVGVSVISKTRRRCGRRPYIHGPCFSRLQISRFPGRPLRRGVAASCLLFALPSPTLHSSLACFAVFRFAASFASLPFKRCWITDHSWFFSSFSHSMKLLNN